MKKFNLSFISLLQIAVLTILLVVGGCSISETEDNNTTANIDLGTANNYVILAKSGVSTTGATAITGDIGLSPADQTSLTGFSETMDSTNVFSTSTYVTGKIYAADYAVPTPAELTTAVSDMETAYTTAAGLSDPDYVDLEAGEIGGLTLEPGLYKWGTGVSITTDVTLSGSDTARWVFQIAEDLTVASSAKVILSGGALPENIVWQVGSSASLGTESHMEGIILTMTSIAMNTGASINGRLLSQSAVTMDANTVKEPGSKTVISE
ncbi:MAG: ice-binding family protein [bacterium]